MVESILFSDLFRNARLTLTNCLRRWRWRRIDYVALRVGGHYPERTVRPRRRFPLSLLPWPPPPPSVDSFALALERVAADPRVKGVVLIVSGLSAGSATLASLRASILRLRQAGKQCIAYLHDLDTWSYYLASACDEILAPESASFRAAGLWTEAVFLKDTLALVGLEADFEAIAEYKVSPDTLRRSEMTAPHREMLESLLDSLYGEVISAVAEGRGVTEERIQILLDAVPLTAVQASEAGLLDGVCYEDELPHRLGTPETPTTLVAWDTAQRQLVQPGRWHSRQGIGVISLVGTIVQGPSQRPPIPIPLPLPLPSAQAGSDTLVQQLRAAARNKRLAAVILHVDSPGGSAFASDLIWREVANLRRVKPVIVYMSNRAASGGYYVSAPASEIVAQATTLTGSIGIWGGKIVSRGLYDKLQAGRQSVSRGRAAGMYADTAPFSNEERAKVRADIGTGYASFKARVAEGRALSDDEVEAVARGRVWTGEQALTHRLVDSLGDLRDAAGRARHLAGLSPRRHAPLLDVVAPKHYVLAQTSPVELGGWLDGLRSLLREGVYALAPWSIRLRG
jgi:protease-4